MIASLACTLITFYSKKDNIDYSNFRNLSWTIVTKSDFSEKVINLRSSKNKDEFNLSCKKYLPKDTLILKDSTFCFFILPDAQGPILTKQIRELTLASLKSATGLFKVEDNSFLTPEILSQILNISAIDPQTGKKVPYFSNGDEVSISYVWGITGQIDEKYYSGTYTNSNSMKIPQKIGNAALARVPYEDPKPTSFYISPVFKNFPAKLYETFSKLLRIEQDKNRDLFIKDFEEIAKPLLRKDVNLSNAFKVNLGLLSDVMGTKKKLFFLFDADVITKIGKEIDSEMYDRVLFKNVYLTPTIGFKTNTMFESHSIALINLK